MLDLLRFGSGAKTGAKSGADTGADAGVDVVNCNCIVSATLYLFSPLSNIISLLSSLSLVCLLSSLSSLALLLSPMVSLLFLLLSRFSSLFALQAPLLTRWYSECVLPGPPRMDYKSIFQEERNKGL